MRRFGLAYAKSAVSGFLGLFASKADNVAKATSEAGSTYAGKAATEMESMLAAGKLTPDAIKNSLGNVVATAAGASKEAAKGSWWTKPLMAVGLGGAAEWLINGKQGLVGGIMNSTWTQLGQMEAEQNTVGRFHSIYKMIQETLAFFGIKDTWVNNWVDEKLTQDHDTTSTYAAASNAVSENLGTTAAIVAAPVVAVAGWKAGKGIAGYFSGGAAGKAATDAVADAADDLTLTGTAAKAEKGFLSRMFSHARGGKGTVAFTAILAGGTFIGALAAGKNTADAAESAATMVPFADAVEKGYKGDTAGAFKSGAVDAVGLGGFAAGMAGGAALGATVGSVVPVFGTAVGGIVGGLAGGIVASGVAATVADYAWDGLGLSNLFNSKAAADTTPANSPAPQRVNFSPSGLALN